MTETPQPQLTAAPARAANIQYERGIGLNASNFDEAWRMAQLFARSELVPKDYAGKPENCLVAMQMGAEVGLKPLQALQGIAVINGRPSIWGDALWALVQNSPLVEDAYEEFDESTETARCVIKRKGRSRPSDKTFSIKDAVLAGLADGPVWKKNRKRMLQMRARAFCSRDAVPDVLKGLHVAEEAIDIPPDAQVEQVATQARAIAAINAIGHDPSPTLNQTVATQEHVAVAQEVEQNAGAASAGVKDAGSTPAGDSLSPIDAAIAQKVKDFALAIALATKRVDVESVTARALRWAPTDAIKDELHALGQARADALQPPTTEGKTE